MTNQRRLIVALLLAGLVLLLAVLFNGSTAVDIDSQNKVTIDLRELEKLNAEWNVNVLHSRTDTSIGYEALSAPLPRMRQIMTSLHEALSMTKGSAAGNALDALTEALHRKELLVEQFKTNNAALRRALAYLPPAVTDLKTELNGIEGAVVPSRTVVRLDAALNALLTDILSYNLAPSAQQARYIEATLGTVLVQKAAFSLAIGEVIDELIGQSRVVLKLRPVENEVEAQITGPASDEAIDRLSAAFDKAFDEVLVQKQRFRTGLFIYSGLLLVLLIYAARRLRRSYTIIGVVNQRLKAANETLEARVAERTAALEAQSERLQKMAQHDSLTGLINYGYLTRLLDHALVRAGRRETTVVVMFIDLDGFKAVNDTYGHGTGDLVLQAVAVRVQARLRKEDALARLGGDEFVILLEEVGAADGARRVASLALDEIRGITEAGGYPVRISASIGISAAHGRAGAGRGAAALLADADQAMYKAKQDGKNGFAFSPNAQWGALTEAAESCPTQ